MRYKIVISILGSFPPYANKKARFQNLARNKT